MPDTSSLNAIRELLLENNRQSRVNRELWNDGQSTYLELRKHIKRQKRLAHRGSSNKPSLSLDLSKAAPGLEQHAQHSAAPSPATTARGVAGSTPGASPSVPASVSESVHRSVSQMTIASSSALGTQPSRQPTSSYTFVGMRCVFDETKIAVTLVRFANIRSDMLAYADCEGGLWLVRDVTSSNPAPVKAPTVHRRPITSLDWSRDNTYILTAALDGLTVWDVATLSPVRTVATPLPSNTITAAIFHSLSANLVLSGNASCQLDVMNASTGATVLSVPAAKKVQKGQYVSALECSSHHVFVGDNTGWVHSLRQDIPRQGTLAKLTHLTKLRVPASDSATPIVGVQYVAFCTATNSPVLLVTAFDSTLAIIKLNQETGLMEVHTRCSVAPMAREIRACVCPLSVMHFDLPRVAMGSEDTAVHIYNISALKSAPSASGATYGSSQLAKPLVVNTLRGHRMPVATVSWAFDEMFLASADCSGLVIVWERAVE